MAPLHDLVGRDVVAGWTMSMDVIQLNSVGEMKYIA